MMRSGFLYAAAVALSLWMSAGSASAAIIVSSNASGGFGEPASGGTPLVLGYTFSAAGESVVISATGTVFMLAPDMAPAGPDGVTQTRAPILGPFPFAYTPLEEKLVDAGTPPPITDPTSTVLNVGGLFAAFVPESLATTPGFLPLDSDLTAVGIPSSALFLVGSGPIGFVASGPGRLYFGVNEPYVSNNAGQFEVTVGPGTVSAVPEPSTFALFAASAVCMAGINCFRRRGR